MASDDLTEPVLDDSDAVIATWTPRNPPSLGDLAQVVDKARVAGVPDGARLQIERLLTATDEPMGWRLSFTWAR